MLLMIPNFALECNGRKDRGSSVSTVTRLTG